MTFRFRYAGITNSNKPGEGSNEDAIYVEGGVHSGEFRTEGELVSDTLNIAVADGLWGTSRRAHAANTLLSLFKRSVERKSAENPGRRVTALHEEYSELGLTASKYRGMASTLVAAEIRGEVAYIYHVGDSRAWLIRDGTCKALTRDHIFSEVYETNSSDIGNAPLAASSQLLSSYFCVDSYAERPKNSNISIPVLAGDTILLTSDGVRPLGETLRLPTSETLLAYLESLCTQAIELGSDDNISLVAVTVFCGESESCPGGEYEKNQ
jgi:serine/threonine protein phosphatase PrpC